MVQKKIMKIFIVANPVASGGDAGAKAKELKKILKQRGHHPEIYLTRFRGDARQKISNISRGIDRIVVVGGDGTVNEILNGITMDCDIPLTQFPTGNANLLGKDLNLPDNALGMVDMIENGKVIKADLATMNGLKFIMVAGVGFDARVTEELKKVRQGKVNNLSYLIPALKALNKKPSIYDVVVDGHLHAKGEIVLICNVRNYAGLFTIAFDAGIDTGVLDVVVVSKQGLFNLGRVLAHSIFGRIGRMRGVTYLKGRQVTITTENPMPVQLDGDFQGRHKEVRISLFPGSLPFFVP